jgi:hypothetical protein
MGKRRGRPPIANECNRRMLHTLRMKRYVLDWLYHQRRSSGEIVEEALIKQHNIQPEDYDGDDNAEGSNAEQGGKRVDEPS